jgi:hypothetical protein
VEGTIADDVDREIRFGWTVSRPAGLGSLRKEIRDGAFRNDAENTKVFSYPAVHLPVHEILLSERRLEVEGANVPLCSLLTATNLFHHS